MEQPVIIGEHYSQFRGCPVVTYDVLYNGEEYRCDSNQLIRLYQGTPPEHLELLRLDEVAKDD
jgi:hypothetical protein